VEWIEGENNNNHTVRKEIRGRVDVKDVPVSLLGRDESLLMIWICSDFCEFWEQKSERISMANILDE